MKTTRTRVEMEKLIEGFAADKIGYGEKNTESVRAVRSDLTKVASLLFDLQD